MQFVTLNDVRCQKMWEARRTLIRALDNLAACMLARAPCKQAHVIVDAARIALAHAENEYWGSDRIPSMEE